MPGAARDDRPGVAHALALGSGPAGDERDLRHVPEVLAGPRRGRLLGRAADLADEHDRIGLVVRGEQLEDVEERRADDGVAADPDAGRLAEPGVGHRLDGLVGQRAGPTHDADPALAMDGARDDPDLGPAGGGRAGTVGADEAGAAGAHDLDGRDHVERRDALGDAEDRGDPGVPPPPSPRRARRRPARRSATCSRRSRGRPRRPCRRPARRHRAPSGRPCPGSRPRRRSCRTPARPRVEPTLAPGDALHDEAGVATDEDAHAVAPVAAGDARRRPWRPPRPARPPSGTAPPRAGRRPPRRSCRRSGRPSGRRGSAARGPRSGRGRPRRRG